MSADALPASPVVAAFDRYWGIRPEDIEKDWIAVMTNRLLREINRQLSSLEAIKYDNPTRQPTAADRLTNARSLATLRDTLEKVARMKMEHEGVIEGRKALDHDGIRGEIERVVDGIAAARLARRDLLGSE
ncbi:MAG TPA: hypothetical protein VMH86_17660 [Rhizomicrobium sp.]|nr:hypothetical protein [Rhizomicrobium sp.]